MKRLLLLVTAALFLGLRPAIAEDPSCKDLFEARSEASTTPATITFINKSGMYRGIMWLDFSGQPKDYANFNHGEEVTLDTFLTHPWMVTDGPGNCLRIVMPHAENRIVELTEGRGTSDELEGAKHGCAPGLTWSAQEGCHEND